MRTDPAATGGPSSALFFFAHQDDEFGVFLSLADERRQGRHVECFFLTDGAFGGVTAETRNAESLEVLGDIGVAPADVHFVGLKLAIGDGQLPARAADARAWIDERLDRCGPDDMIYVPAWEGGHQDHDALHVLVVRAAERRALLDRVRQFPLYNKYRVPKPLFRVLNALPENGPTIRIPIARDDRKRHVAYCLRYRSQWRSWAGLLPFVMLHYLLDGRQTLQHVSLKRLAERPHRGRLLYEARGTADWASIARLSSGP